MGGKNGGKEGERQEEAALLPREDNVMRIIFFKLISMTAECFSFMVSQVNFVCVSGGSPG